MILAPSMVLIKTKYAYKNLFIISKSMLAIHDVPTKVT